MICTSKNVERLHVYILLAAINVGVTVQFLKVPRLQQDYRAFYQAGLAARFSPSSIYNLGSQFREHVKLFGSFIPYIHAPHELLLFAPLSLFPYSLSLLLWRLAMVLSLFAAGWMIGHDAGLPKWIGPAVAFAMYPMAMNFSLGQDSILLLLVIAGSFRLLKRGHDDAAGALLALGVFKPQLPLLLAIAMLAYRRWCFFVSFAVSCLMIAIASFAYIGREGVLGLLDCLQLAEDDLNIHRMPTIRGLIATFIGDHQRLAAAISVLVLTTLVFVVGRRANTLEFVWAECVCVSCVIAHHLFAHDAIVLTLPLALLLGLPRSRWGQLIQAGIMSTPLYAVLLFFGISSVMVVPTIALMLASFRLNSRNNSQGSALGGSEVNQLGTRGLVAP